LDAAALVDEALDPKKKLITICTAPAEGLFLDAALFDQFNLDAKERPKPTGNQQQPIDFFNDEQVRSARESVIHSVIMPVMFPPSGEGHKVFTGWIHERDKIPEFPKFVEIGTLDDALGDAEHFLRHVLESRFKKWIAEERQRRG